MCPSVPQPAVESTSTARGVARSSHSETGLSLFPPSDDFCRLLVTYVNRGSYMSAHVLLNLLNEIGKSDKMRGFFCKEFNKFNNTRARMLDSIYHLTQRLLQNIFSCKKA